MRSARDARGSLVFPQIQPSTLSPTNNNNKIRGDGHVAPFDGYERQFACVAVWLAGAAIRAAGGLALTGKVTAGQEALEGVLVSAKKSGSTITVTVVSDKDGRYSFPGGKARARRHIRCASGRPATISTVRARSRSQRTRPRPPILPCARRRISPRNFRNAEWLASMPGTDAQKGQLLNCVGCHTLERAAALEIQRR